MTHDSSEVINWVSLLDVACRSELDNFVITVGDYLVNHQKEWIKTNVITVYNHHALSSNLVKRLLDHCNQIMVSMPKVIIESGGLGSIPKETSIYLLRHDRLNLEEIDIWILVVQWAIKQVPGLVDEPNDWSSADVVKVREHMSDFIPYIRFFNIPTNDFREKVVPYDELLSKELRRDLLHYQLDNNYKPKSKYAALAPRMGQKVSI